MFLDKKTLLFLKKILFIFSLFFAFIQTNPHAIVLAAEPEVSYGRGPIKSFLNNDPNSPRVAGDETSITTLPETESVDYYVTYITATAYTSRASETDNSPFIAAWGDHVYWGMVASNAFPKGTKIQIPDYYGDKIFTVLDRMNSRYYYRLDIWMPELADAKNWGSRYIKINVLK